MQSSQDVKWESISWTDGSLYEGLTQHGKQHRSGVMLHGNGDRYEGEFVDGHMDGYGVYVWNNGTVYRGQWMRDIAHGCGVRMWRAAGAAGQVQVRAGKFAGDEFVGPVMSCSEDVSHSSATEADVAAHLARTFLTPQGQTHAARQRRGHSNSKPSQQPATPGESDSRRPGGSSTQGGWGFKWLWQQQGGGSQAGAASAPTPSVSGSQATGLQGGGDSSSHTATRSGAGRWVGRGRGMSEGLDAGPMIASSGADLQGLVGTSLPAGHPALDADVGFRTRGLRADEQAQVAQVVQHFMAAAAQDRAGTQGTTSKQRGS